MLAISLQLPQPDVTQHCTAQTTAHIQTSALYSKHAIVYIVPTIDYI